MKTAVSLPDDLFTEADAMAARLGMSRSQLYASALAEYLARHREADVTDALNRVYDDVFERDAARQNAARATLRRSEWT